MRWLRRHPIGCYLGITFAVTWGAWLSLALTGRVVTVGLSPIYLVGLVGPLVGAIATSAIVAGATGVRALLARMLRVRTGARWWGVALSPLAIGLVLGIGALLIATFGFGHEHGWRDLGAFNGFPLTTPVVLWLLLVVINGFGEETGWRGYLLPHLQTRYSPLAASLIVGAIWCVWHVPAFAITETYRAMPAAMIPVFLLGILAGSVFLAWLYNRGKSSILLVAFWHGTYNLFSGSVAARGVFGAIETAVVMVIAAALVIAELRTHHAMEPRPISVPKAIW